MKKLVVGAAVIAAGVTAWKWTSSTTPTTKTKELAFDRLWIDHIPKNERDRIKVFVAITEEPVGIFQTASMWSGEYEMFQYEAIGNEIRAVFPQDREKEKFTAKGTRCDEGGFDYCLEMSGTKRGTKRYYSMKGWELDGAMTADQVKHRIEARIDSLVHDAPHVE